MVDAMEPRPKATRCKSSIKQVFSGTLVHSTAENMMDVCQNKIIGVDDDGKVTESGHFAKQFNSLKPFDVVAFAFA